MLHDGLYEQVINKAQNDGFDIQKENIQTDIEKLKTKLIKLKDSAIESCFTAERYKTALYNFEHSSEAIKRTIVRKNIDPTHFCEGSLNQSVIT